MPRYDLVVSDMDETFLDNDHRIPAANVDALRRMRELGVLFVPSSGRPYASIVENFAAAGREVMEAMEGSYVISFNGGFINRFGDPEPLSTCSIDREAAEDLYRRGIELGVCQHVYVPSGRIIALDADDAERSRIASVAGVEFASSADHTNLSSLIGDDPVVKMIYELDDFPGLRRLGDEIGPSMAPHGIDVTYSSNRYLELVRAGVDKGTGLARLADMLGIPLARTIAVGDSANDASMVHIAGLGAGVANATDDLRPVCDVILASSNADGALAEILDRYLKE